MHLDVAFSDRRRALRIDEVVWTGHADPERVLARTWFGVVARVDREPVTRLAVHLRVAFEGGALPREHDRVDAAGAMDLDARGTVVVVERPVHGRLLGHKPEVHLRTEPATTGDLVSGLRWGRWGRSGARYARVDPGDRRELVCEVRANKSAAGRIVGSVVGPDDRVDFMVVRERDVRAVQRIEGDLEVIGKAAVGAAAQPAGRDRPAVDDVIADDALREHWEDRIVAVDAFRVVDVPLRPSGHAARAAVPGSAL